MKVIRTKVELDESLRTEIEKALNLTYKEVYRELKDIVAERYDSYDPIFYQRTYSLLNDKNWLLKIYKYNSLYARIEFVGDDFIYNPEQFVHTNGIGSSNISPQRFMGVMNGTRDVGDAFNFPSISTFDGFWDEFLDWCDSNINKIFKKKCKRLGLDLIPMKVQRVYR